MATKCSSYCYSPAKGFHACPDYAINESIYCKHHAYMLDFTPEQIESIKNEEMKHCEVCNKWHERDGKRCQGCRDKRKANYQMKKDPNYQPSKCEGILDTRENCTRNSTDDNKYCNYHDYMKKFTKEQIKMIKDKDSSITPCNKCHHWHTGKNNRCDDCKEGDRKNNLKAAEKKNKPKCIGIDRYGDPCKNNQLLNIKFCNFHIHMKNYTDEQMNNLTRCSGCLKYYYMVEQLMCDSCKLRSTINNTKIKENTYYCNGITRKFEKCNQKLDNVSQKFCDSHIHMNNYTDEQMNNLSQCSGCHIPHFYSGNDYSTSDSNSDRQFDYVDHIINSEEYNEDDKSKPFVKKSKIIIIDGIRHERKGLCPKCKNRPKNILGITVSIGLIKTYNETLLKNLFIRYITITKRYIN